MAARGIAAFVLFYRLWGDGWAAGPDVVLQDTQRAISVIKHQEKDFGTANETVTVIGYYASGHAGTDLAARFEQPVYQAVDNADRLSARPSLAASI